MSTTTKSKPKKIGRTVLAKYFHDNGYEPIAPHVFYREMFPQGELAPFHEDGSYDPNVWRYNGIILHRTNQTKEVIKHNDFLKDDLIVKRNFQFSNMAPHSAPRIMERESIIENYFLNNHMRDVSIDELAERLHLCTRRVSQLIQQLYGCSFSQKLCTTRIEIAKLRLLYSDDSVQDIGLLCGFNSPNYFFTTFRKFTGMSPREYRLSAKVPFPDEVKYNW